MVVRETGDGKFDREISEKTTDELPEGELLIQVDYSCLNYKDALSASGNKGVTKQYPHTPGIEAVGVVRDSQNPSFSNGDEVLLIGDDLGMNTPGGFGQYVRVPASWAMKRPAGLSPKENMAIGAAGFTAALCLSKLEKNGIRPDSGEILVTGATGGVGSLAVAILAKAGYPVIAATRKTDETDYLKTLGAKDVLDSNELYDDSKRPLLKGRWAGAIDTVGGNILATVIKSIRYNGAVSCCGNAASADLPLTVFPFILRSVSLLGVDSALCPMEERLKIWRKLTGEWKPDHLDSIMSECSLDELNEKIELILQGKVRGRVVVDLSG